jgi:UDP-galactopyranose mutase
VGRELYELFFRGYTRKQWGLDPSELDASVTARVPTRFSRDDRYFTDRFQAMPRHGYTRLFENLLDHPNVKLMLNTDHAEISQLHDPRHTFYTGPVDEYFDFRFGELPYRSIQFTFATHDREYVQPAAVINHPTRHRYTRITEFKHLTGQNHPRTTVVHEFPCAHGDPYYPVPRPQNRELYGRYERLASGLDDVTFLGRLGTYRYYNMDQVVAQALKVARTVAGPLPQTAAVRARRLTNVPA